MIVVNGYECTRAFILKEIIEIFYVLWRELTEAAQPAEADNGFDGIFLAGLGA